MFDRTCDALRYAELHAHSAYSFLDGANEPEDLIQAAAGCGLEALALTDYDGFPGAVKLARASREIGLPTIFGSELTLTNGAHLPILARGPRGYQALSELISTHNLQAGERRDPAHEIPQIAQALGQDCLILTGTANGPLRRCLGHPGRPERWDVPAARTWLASLIEQVGREQVLLEIALDGGPSDAPLTQVLEELAGEFHLPLVATGAVRCARPQDAPLADVLTATRLNTDLEGAAGHLPALGRWIRSPQDMARLHRRAPYAVDQAAEIGADLAFDLALVAPDLPAPEVGVGHTPSSWLRELTRRGALARYGTRTEDPHAWSVLDHELEVIDSLGFAGYFLIVRSIVDFCHRAGILCQGRGSAANSAVCYALGITAVDAVRHNMLFERFLSPGRKGYPDIDLDIEACRREEVIQYVYERYGRHYAAQVANVISYRPRSAIRDAARALGYPAGLQDAWARHTERGWSRSRKRGQAGIWADEPSAPTQVSPSTGGSQPATQDPTQPPGQGEVSIPSPVIGVANQLLLLPRHLGVHSGGMVLTATPVTQVCPVRWAAMEGRSVLQWDKDDCADAGLVKFDLLGLGMLTALRLAFTSLGERGESVPDVEEVSGQLRPAQVGRPWGLHTLPEEDPAVYRLLQAADTVGVFQVESRAQMATLPRLAPRCFYDIVVEVALIRPGPIQGDAVNPYIRRRLGQEKVTYLHPLLEPALAKTLGVPLFQEQLMQIAVDAAGFSPAQADALRQAMGAKRSVERMEALHAQAVEGMMARGISREVAEQIFDKLRAFADFGFPESHAFSFAYLVYASAWLKVRKPEDFYAGILAAQPMGFWSPMTLVADARRHGVRVLAADINYSRPQASVERYSGSEEVADSSAALSPLDVHPGLAVRLGLAPLRGLGASVAERIVSEREAGGPYTSMEDLARRVKLSRTHLEVLASSGALESLSVSRREALWKAGALAGEYGHEYRSRRKGNRAEGRLGDLPGQRKGGRSGGLSERWEEHREGRSPTVWYQPPLPGTAVGVEAPPLPPMSQGEERQADIELTGSSVSGHPMEQVRPMLRVEGVLPAGSLAGCEHGRRVRVAGIVTHRQRPHTAAGTVFLNLEDETGLLNVICPPGMWRHYRSIGKRASALVVRGCVENVDGVTALLAERLEPLLGVRTVRSRDWA